MLFLLLSSALAIAPMTGVPVTFTECHIEPPSFRVHHELRGGGSHARAPQMQSCDGMPAQVLVTDSERAAIDTVAYDDAWLSAETTCAGGPITVVAEFYVPGDPLFVDAEVPCMRNGVESVTTVSLEVVESSYALAYGCSASLAPAQVCETHVFPSSPWIPETPVEQATVEAEIVDVPEPVVCEVDDSPSGYACCVQRLDRHACRHHVEAPPTHQQFSLKNEIESFRAQNQSSSHDHHPNTQPANISGPTYESLSNDNMGHYQAYKICKSDEFFGCKPGPVQVGDYSDSGFVLEPAPDVDDQCVSGCW